MTFAHPAALSDAPTHATPTIPRILLSQPGAPEAMLVALVETGCVVVRRALDPIATRMYRDDIIDWFDQLDARIAGGERNDFLDVFRVQSGMSLSPQADSQSQPPRTARDILALLHRSGLTRFCQSLFQRQPLLFLMDFASIRRQKPGENHKALGFHQDGPVVGFHNNAHTGLVFWIPLTAVDKDTPGLEVVPQAPRQYLSHAANRKSTYLEANEPIVGDTATLTDLEIGDLAIFTMYTPHRTQLLPAMTKTRFSVDLRAIPFSLLPMSKKGWSFTP